MIIEFLIYWAGLFISYNVGYFTRLISTNKKFKTAEYVGRQAFIERKSIYENPYKLDAQCSEIWFLSYKLERERWVISLRDKKIEDLEFKLMNLENTND